MVRRSVRAIRTHSERTITAHKERDDSLTKNARKATEEIQGPPTNDGHAHSFYMNEDGLWACKHCPEKRNRNGRFL